MDHVPKIVAGLLGVAVVVMAFVVAMMPGGSGGSNGGGNPTSTGETKQGFRPIEIPVDDLPVGEYLPPLDDGRIELAEPEGWERFPRSKNYVARFYLTSSTSLPRIIVTAVDTPHPHIKDVTADNHEALLKAVMEEVGEKASLLEVPEPVTIGGGRYIRYVIAARLGAEGAERQVLVTVLGGRRYEIDLQIKKPTIQQFKKTGYAVASSLRKAESTMAPPPKKGEASKKKKKAAK